MSCRPAETPAFTVIPPIVSVLNWVPVPPVSTTRTSRPVMPASGGWFLVTGMKLKLVAPAMRLFGAGAKPLSAIFGSLRKLIATTGVLEETGRTGVVPATTL